MNIFNFPIYTHITTVLQKLIYSNQDPVAQLPYLIIAPNQKAKKVCEEYFYTYPVPNKLHIVSISDPKEILKALFNLTSNPILRTEVEKLIAISPISETTQNGLMFELIKNIDPTLSIQQALSLAREFSNILDILATENLSLAELNDTELPITTDYSKTTLSVLKTLEPLWRDRLKQLNRINLINYKIRVLQLTTKIIETKAITTNIITFSINFYYTAYIKFLAAVAAYKNGKVILHGLDKVLDEAEWHNLTNTHPQYVHSRILQKLKLPRKQIDPVPIKLDIQSTPTTAKHEFLHRLFDKIPAKAPDIGNLAPEQLSLFPNTNIHNFFSHISYLELNNQEIEVQVIVDLIKRKLERSPQQKIAVVAGDYGLRQRIALKLKMNKIPYDNAVGSQLIYSPHYKFFQLITKIDITNINFVDLLALLKHPLSKYAHDSYYIQLIDLYLARDFNPYMSLKEYLDVLDKIEQQHKITLEESHKLQQIITDIIEIYTPFASLDKTALNFKNTLQMHIDLANQLSGGLVNDLPNPLWEESSGSTLKEALEIITVEAAITLTVSLEEYHIILQNLFKPYVIPNKASSRNQILIYDILQAEYLPEKTHVIIAGLNEGSFPSAIRSETASTYHILQKFELPTAANRIGQEALIFHKLCTFPKVYLTRSVKQQNELTTQSRFCTKLLNTLAKNHHKLDNTDLQEVLANIEHTISTYETNNLSNHPIPAPTPPLHYRPRQINVTAIETLLQNPYKYFIKHILQLQELSRLNPALEARERGNIIHKILNKFFTQPLAQLKKIDKNAIAASLQTHAYEVLTPYAEKYDNSLVVHHIFKYFSIELAEYIYQLIQDYNYIKSETKVSWPTTEVQGLIIDGRADFLAIHDTAGIIIDFKCGSSPHDHHQKLKSRTQEIKELQTWKKQLILLAHMVNHNGVGDKFDLISSLEYWYIPNTLSKKIYRHNLNDLLKPDNLVSYVKEDIKDILKQLAKYLTTTCPFEYLESTPEYSMEYQHFRRKITPVFKAN